MCVCVCACVFFQMTKHLHILTHILIHDFPSCMTEIRNSSYKWLENLILWMVCNPTKVIELSHHVECLNVSQSFETKYRTNRDIRNSHIFCFPFNIRTLRRKFLNLWNLKFLIPTYDHNVMGSHFSLVSLW